MTEEQQTNSNQRVDSANANSGERKEARRLSMLSFNRYENA